MAKNYNTASVMLNVLAILIGTFTSTMNAAPDRKGIGFVVGAVVCTLLVLINSFLLKMENKEFLMYPFCGNASGTIRSFYDFIKVVTGFVFLVAFYKISLLISVKVNSKLMSRNQEKSNQDKPID